MSPEGSLVIRCTSPPASLSTPRWTKDADRSAKERRESVTCPITTMELSGGEKRRFALHVAIMSRWSKKDGWMVEQEMSSAELPSPHAGVQRTLARKPREPGVRRRRHSRATSGSQSARSGGRSQTPWRANATGRRTAAQDTRRKGDFESSIHRRKKEFTSNDDVEKRGDRYNTCTCLF